MPEGAQVIKDSDIKRGKIFRTAFPFLDERPLKFLEECAHNRECQHACAGHDYCGRIVKKVDGFEADDDRVLNVITQFKARYAMVLSTSVLNENKRFPNVIVAPIVGIYKDEMQKPFIKRVINMDLSAFTAYYLGDGVTGKPCYVDLGKIRPVPKNWLLQDKYFVDDEHVFNGISERLGLTLAQKKLVDCDKCKRPCDKCELKDEIEKLKRQLEPKGV